MNRFCRTRARAAVIAVTRPKNFHNHLKRNERNLRLTLDPDQRAIERLQELRAVGL
jgi:hypothetical protein